MGNFKIYLEVVFIFAYLCITIKRKAMNTKVTYEWSLETYDDHGDITENDFSETPFTDVKENQKLCLVRNEGNDRDGVTDRLWAYIKDGELPEYFSDGSDCEIGVKVPQKFKKQLSKLNA